MKNFIKIIFFICLYSFCIQNSFAEQKDLVTKPKANLTSSEEVSEVINRYMAFYSDIDTKYPGQEIEKDFSAEIKKIFPKLSNDELQYEVGAARTVIKVYRLGKNVYNQYIERKLAPEAPPLVLDDSQYDTQDEYKYIESDAPVVINDFKKIISPLASKRDFESMKAKHLRALAKKASPDEKSWLELQKLLSNVDFKKVFLAEHHPFLGKDGIGAWNKNGGIKVRIISDKANYNSSAKYAIHVDLKPGIVMISEAFSKINKTSFDFSKSVNIKNPKIILPVPTRLVSLENDTDYVGYLGNFAIPFTFDIVDESKPVVLDVMIKASLCGNDKCFIQDINASHQYRIGEDKSSLVSNYVRLVYSHLPTSTDEKLKISSFYEAQTKKNNVIKLVVENYAKIKGLQVFVESEDGIILSKPRIAINDNKIYVNLNAIETDASLIGKKFIVTIKVNNENLLRKTLVLKKVTIFDTSSLKLNIGLLFIAILGGFILNFMPCVFPVLSLKILSFNKFGKKNIENVKKDFMYVVLGIFSAFIIMVIALSLLKFLGYQLGWGIQFQSVSFLVVMVFVIAMFMLKISDVFYTPKFVEKLLYGKNIKNENALNFFTGLFLVILATPCSAPYLATVIGFALSGTYLELVITMLFVAIGLSLPYLLMVAFPFLISLLPNLGKWNKIVNYIMNLMLLLTIAWLASIIYAQTSLYFILRLSLYLSLFVYALYFYKHINLSLDVIDMESNLKAKLSKIFKVIIVAISVSIVVVGVIDARNVYRDKKTQTSDSANILVTEQLIKDLVKEGDIVLLEIGANWCITCQFNNANVLNTRYIEEFLELQGVVRLKIDWSNYNKDVLNYMEKFGRKGIPFYVMFSPRVPRGIVLPEVLSNQELRDIVLSL